MKKNEFLEIANAELVAAGNVQKAVDIICDEVRGADGKTFTKRIVTKIGARLASEIGEGVRVSLSDLSPWDKCGSITSREISIHGLYKPDQIAGWDKDILKTSTGYEHKIACDTLSFIKIAVTDGLVDAKKCFADGSYLALAQTWAKGFRETWEEKIKAWDKAARLNAKLLALVKEYEDAVPYGLRVNVSIRGGECKAEK